MQQTEADSVGLFYILVNKYLVPFAFLLCNQHRTVGLGLFAIGKQVK